MRGMEVVLERPGVKRRRRGTGVLWLTEVGIIHVGEEVVGAEAAAEGVGEVCGGKVGGEAVDEILKNGCRGGLLSV